MALRQHPKMIRNLSDRTRKATQVRSASRIGYSDLGKNRSRREDIRGKFMTAGEKQ
jgi:uncharacterized protein (DUF1499 family)